MVLCDLCTFFAELAGCWQSGRILSDPANFQDLGTNSDLGFQGQMNSMIQSVHDS